MHSSWFDEADSGLCRARGRTSRDTDLAAARTEALLCVPAASGRTGSDRPHQQSRLRTSGSGLMSSRPPYRLPDRHVQGEWKTVELMGDCTRVDEPVFGARSESVTNGQAYRCCEKSSAATTLEKMARRRRRHAKHSHDAFRNEPMPSTHADHGTVCMTGCVGCDITTAGADEHNTHRTRT